MTDVYISADYLRAAMICASTEKGRYYLNGVYVDAAGFIVSTDGHRAFIGRFDPCEAGDGSQRPAPASFGGYIIPLATLKRVLAGNKARLIAVSGDEIDGQRYEPIDGTFPDWRRIIPAAHPSGVAGQFNPDYLGDMGKIGALVAGGGKGNLRAHLHHDGPSNPVGVTFPNCNDAFAVLMPMRSDNDSAVWDNIRAIV